MESALRKATVALWATASFVIFIIGSAGSGLAASATIRDPAFGLPHVCGDNDLDAARAEGYSSAEDRIGQFLLIMGTARGTLHGALGNLGVGADGDIEARRSGYSRNELNRMYNMQSADDRALILAYCEGVNNAINDMMVGPPIIPPSLELLFFKQSAVAGKANIFGNKNVLTQGEGPDPFYQPLGSPGFAAGGFQFTPELAMAFATLQIRNFGFEAWDEIGMAEDLAKLITTYGAATGAELWDDRHWKNDPLAPASVPDPRNPGFGGPLSLSVEQKIELVEAVGRVEDRVLGRARLPGYPMRDYTKALEPVRQRRDYRERTARKWGAWPKLGSYAWTIAANRSATGNPWVGGFPQTGIQVPSIMHYTEIRGDTIQGNGMAFVGGPYVLIGHSDKVAFSTTTAHMKMIDSYVEELVNGDFDVFNYDHHGSVEPMSKRIELVYRPNQGPLSLPVFRTNNICSVNGCTGGNRPVLAFSGDHAGSVSAATATSITDTSAAFSVGSLAGGYVAIVDGTGAGQMREIATNTADTITTVAPFTVTPDDTAEYVAVDPGNFVTAVSFETVVWLGEGQAAAGFGGYQKATSLLDVREALRLIPSTHNFVAADNNPYNGIGTDAGNGNIYYGTSGYKRVRQNGVDPRLPLDGSAAKPFAVVTGVVGSAATVSLTDVGSFAGKTFAAAPINFTYDNPDNNGSEYIVTITAGDSYGQRRRIVSNTDDTLSLEHAWGVVPSPGDTYAVYEVWATPEAMNPAEGFTANWNNKQSRANDIMLSRNGRNHRVELILEQLSLDSSIDRDDQRDLNKYVAGVVDPGTLGRYLLTRLQEAIAFAGDCGSVDDELIAQNAFPERGREFTNPLVIEPAGTSIANAISSAAPAYIESWATTLAADIYGDEYDPAGVAKISGDAAIGWILHAVDAAAGDVAGAYSNVYAGDYFGGSDWRQVVRDSFCTFVASNPSVGTKQRSMRDYNHPLGGLPCQADCDTPIRFDSTPRGNRGTWEQIVEVASVLQGEFMYPMGQSGFNGGSAAGFTGNGIKQSYHSASLQPLWRDWRFAPMLQVCEDVSLGVDEDGDTDGDGVLDGFEKWYYAGSLANDASSDTDGDGASLATEYRWGSDPTIADTDADGVPDGSDIQPQDRLCVQDGLSGPRTKARVRYGSAPGADKIRVRWEVGLDVCVGGDYETRCSSDADCGGVGRCQRIGVDPRKDTLRILIADDTPIFDEELGVLAGFWKKKGALADGQVSKYRYKDKAGANGPIRSIVIRMDPKRNRTRIALKTGRFDLDADPDVAAGVFGISVGTRCFMETAASCSNSGRALICDN